MHDDGVVLIDLRHGKYHAFNHLGALVWQRLAAGDDERTILHQLKQLHPEAGRRVANDLRNLLRQLRSLGLVRPAGGGPDPRESESRPFAPMAGRGEDRSPRQRRATSQPAAHSAGIEPARPPAERRFFDGLVGWITLVAIDVLLKVVGFRSFYRFLRCRTVRRRGAATVDVERVCRRLDRAARYYFKRAWCLQRSAATVFLLRRAGVYAELVIGVRQIPFLAHAWVEVDGRVVNDRPSVKNFYQEIERC